MLVEVAVGDDVVAFEIERGADAPPRRVAPNCARLVGVHHPGAVRRGREAEIGDQLVQRHRLPDVRLPVVGTQHDRVPREQLVEAAGRVDEGFTAESARASASCAASGPTAWDA